VATLLYTDNRKDPAAWARRLGIPREAVELYLRCEVVDPHTCSFIWARYRYDLSKRHRPHLRGTPFFNQVDFPRAREAAFAGITWDITTNPLRGAAGRRAVFLKNIARLRRLFEQHPAELRLVRSLAEYRAARAAGLLACWIGVQGGNAVPAELLGETPDLSRITLVHFTQSEIGTSANDALRRGDGLSAYGKDYVARMVAARIQVDLSHINRRGFFDALDVMPAHVPPVVTHTGMRSLRDVRRNIDDEQALAVARRGGVIGVIYQGNFLTQTRYDYGLSDVADHMQRVVDVCGEDHVGLGSDYDGMVILPRDLPDITHQPRLVAELLRRGWGEERIRKLLGANWLRVLGEIRPA
jgi:membrane dipeptidase